MTSLTRFFFRSPTFEASTTWSVIEWWESRRFIYNAAVGAAGVASLAAITLFENLPPHAGHFQLPWELVIVYGVMANLSYCLGPLADLAICKRWGAQFASVGPTLFRYGFAFAIGLSILPIPVAALNWIARVIFSAQAGAA